MIRLRLDANFSCLSRKIYWKRFQEVPLPPNSVPALRWTSYGPPTLLLRISFVRFPGQKRTLQKTVKHLQKLDGSQNRHFVPSSPNCHQCQVSFVHNFTTSHLKLKHTTKAESSRPKKLIALSQHNPVGRWTKLRSIAQELEELEGFLVEL